MQLPRILFYSLLIIMLHGAWAWFTNQAQVIPASNSTGKLSSVSFAPFWKGYSPLAEKYPLPEQIDADLQLLADKTDSIRTYASLDGMEPTPELAAKYGISMIQGCWLGTKPLQNQGEIAALIASANAHPDTVKSVMVGNEVLLRKDMDVDSLIGFIRSVKQAVKQPVSYADVWSIYLKYPQLINEVDFITIHILPYWEDEPIPVHQAVEHLEKIVAQIQALAPNKRILIGETGWPTMGRQRSLAEPGIINAASYINSMIASANTHGFDYNIVEAFNQPWKSEFEGVVGANWGLMTVDRTPVFPLTGKISENPHWTIHYVLQTLLCLLIIGTYIRQLQFKHLSPLLIFIGLAQLISINLIDMTNFLWSTSYTLFETSYSLFIIAANALLSKQLMQRIIDLLKNQQTARKVSLSLGYGYAFFAALAVVKTILLACVGRYLSIPVEQFAIPVIGIVALSLCESIRASKFKWHNLTLTKLTDLKLAEIYLQRLGFGLQIALLVMVFGETINFLVGQDFVLAHPDFINGLPIALGYTLFNKQLLLWLLSLSILAVPFLCATRLRYAK